MGTILGDENNVICAISWVPYDHSFLMRKNFVNCHHGCTRNISLAIMCWSIQWSFKYANIDWLQCPSNWDVTKYFLPQVFAMFDSKENTSNIQRTLSGLNKVWGFPLQSMWSHLWGCFDFLRSFSIMQILPKNHCTKSKTVSRFIHHKETNKGKPIFTWGFYIKALCSIN